MKKIVLKDLSIGYDKNPLINEISATLEQGKIALLIGKNGVGKTTLIKTIMQFIPLISGKIQVNDTDLNFQNFSQHVSVVLSNTNIHSDLTVYELLELGRFPYKKWYQKTTKEERKWIDEVIEFTHLESYKNHTINELSDGNLQKGCIARAMVQNTDFLILDEPTTHLDLENKLIILQLLQNFSKEFKKGILFTSHDWEYAFKISDELWSFDNQKFRNGATEDLALELELFEQIPNYKFNYLENHFEPIKTINNKIIDLEINDEKVKYWLKQALLKQNFILESNSSLKIKHISDEFLIYNEVDLIFKGKTIKETLCKLKTIS